MTDKVGVVSTKRKRGRPRLDRTREEKNRMARESKKRLDTKNLAINGELLEMIHVAQNNLSTELGIPLSIKQTMHLLLKRSKYTGGKL